jgi:hypothetical protein
MHPSNYLITSDKYPIYYILFIIFYLLGGKTI